MSIEKPRYSKELKAVIRAEYETTSISPRKLASTYGVAARTLSQWARTEGWRRNYTANLPAPVRSTAVIEHLRENPEATAGELAMVAHKDISKRRVDCELHCEQTATALHSLMNLAIKEKDGPTLAVLTAAAKGLEAVAKTRREALGMVAGVCYRALTKE